MDVFLKAYTPRVFMGVVFAAIIWWTAQIGDNGQFPFYYYVVIIISFLIHQVRSESLGVYSARPG